MFEKYEDYLVMTESIVPGFLLTNGLFFQAGTFNRLGLLDKVASHENIASYLTNLPKQEALTKALNEGVIRFAYHKGYFINLGKRPTDKQYRVLESLNYDREVTVEVSDGYRPKLNDSCQYEKEVSGYKIVFDLENYFNNERSIKLGSS
jgi:hypothetical protein